MANVEHRLPSLPNLRDLGGPSSAAGTGVRAGAVFRSESPSLASPADVEALHSDLRIAEVVDLRRTDDHDAAPLPPGLAARARWHRVPFDIEAPPDIPSPAPSPPGLTSAQMGRFYAWMVQRNVPQLREVLALLADVESPALVHCAIGKDRTGVTVAITLLALGVGRPAVVADYARSDASMRSVVPRFDPRITDEVLASDMRLRAPAASMDACLDELTDVYGSVAAFLDELDADGSTRRRLRARLLTEQPVPD